MNDYKGAYSVSFEKVNDFLESIKNVYNGKIDYEKIKFNHYPEKISLVIADNRPKDLFAYYRNNGFIEMEHIDLRKYFKEKKIKKNII